MVITYSVKHETFSGNHVCKTIATSCDSLSSDLIRRKCPETLGKSAYGACLLHSLFQGFNHPRIKPVMRFAKFITYQ